MTVVDLRTYSKPDHVPVLVVVDPQQEYQAEHRALRLPDPAPAIQNCQLLVDFARSRGFPVAVTRWRQHGKFLSDIDGFGGWLHGLEPCGSDMVFEKSTPSCYGSEEFSRMMRSGGGDCAVVAGFTGTLACLSTIVDGYHRQHNLTFISDASASHCLDGYSSSETERIAASVISLYGPVMNTSQWMETTRIRTA
ncbi:MAG: cysteine hydrolase [Hyphomicrobiales bacterium]|nr:cysteine hydrolase [Hyphomicrobiales bacterium]